MKFNSLAKYGVACVWGERTKMFLRYFVYLSGACKSKHSLFIYLGVLRRFQHFTGHITMGSWKGRGNQYIQFVRVLYYQLPTNGTQLPAFPLEAVLGIEPQPQRWEARVLPLCHRGPPKIEAFVKYQTNQYLTTI